MRKLVLRICMIEIVLNRTLSAMIEAAIFLNLKFLPCKQIDALNNADPCTR